MLDSILALSQRWMDCLAPKKLCNCYEVRRGAYLHGSGRVRNLVVGGLGVLSKSIVWIGHEPEGLGVNEC